MISRMNLINPRYSQFSTAKNVRIRHYKSTTSTMDLAMNNLTKDIQCFVADQQTNGIGQHSNKWESHDGNIHMTLSLPITLRSLRLLPAISCLSVCQMLQNTLKCKTHIKWINDVFINDRKIGGILVKSSISVQTIAMIGIGINVERAPAEAICMKQILNQDYDKMSLVRQTIQHMLMNIQHLQEGNSKMVIEKVQNRLLYLNKKIKIYDSSLKSVICQGIFKGLSENYEAIVNVHGHDRIFLQGRMRDI